MSVLEAEDLLVANETLKRTITKLELFLVEFIVVTTVFVSEQMMSQRRFEMKGFIAEFANMWSVLSIFASSPMFSQILDGVGSVIAEAAEIRRRVQVPVASQRVHAGALILARFARVALRRLIPWKIKVLIKISVVVEKPASFHLVAIQMSSQMSVQSRPGVHFSIAEEAGGLSGRRSPNLPVRFHHMNL